ncbi:MAG TPA: ribose 5-phosphate isomerase B [Flavobacteriales bacterium]|jgi:ribose 5-phosphate isomerase B
MKRIHIGADHAGFELKTKVIEKLKAEGYEVVDHGTHSLDSVDYPDYAHPTAAAVEKEKGQGILICGSANGVAITANKHQGIRAAICWSVEISKLARQHNDANILCIPARFVSEQEAMNIVDAFFTTDFEGGRHLNRVNKIACQ